MLKEIKNACGETYISLLSLPNRTTLIIKSFTAYGLVLLGGILLLLGLSENTQLFKM